MQFVNSTKRYLFQYRFVHNRLVLQSTNKEKIKKKIFTETEYFKRLYKAFKIRKKNVN